MAGKTADHVPAEYRGSGQCLVGEQSPLLGGTRGGVNRHRRADLQVAVDDVTKELVGDDRDALPNVVGDGIKFSIDRRFQLAHFKQQPAQIQAPPLSVSTIDPGLVLDDLVDSLIDNG